MVDLDSRIRRADEMYGLIEDGDRIAVGLSGGKDSTALLWALVKLRSYDDKRFDLVGITIDPCFGNGCRPSAPRCQQWYNRNIRDSHSQ